MELDDATNMSAITVSHIFELLDNHCGDFPSHISTYMLYVGSSSLHQFPIIF